MSISLKEGDACPYCHKGIMESAGSSVYCLRCSECGEYWYYDYSDTDIENSVKGKSPRLLT